MRTPQQCAGSAEGHTIGTHSEDHPVRFGKLSTPLVEWEIDKGILDVGAALDDPQTSAFRDWRAPTLLRVSLRLGYSSTSAPTRWRMTGITVSRRRNHYAGDEPA
jgi:hypothetical protein